MNVQILEKDGQPEFAVLAFDDYQALLNAQEELNDIKESSQIKADITSGQEETIPAEIVNRLLNDENPIKVWREYRNIDQVEMANKLGITPSFLSQIETGKKTGSIKTRRKIADFLNLDLDDIE